MKVGIVGAGASGMMAAVTAADYGAEVIVFERNERIGKKILATGNGKCNISNLTFHMEQYYCDDRKKLRRLFSLFSPYDTISFFESNGMMVRNKNGYLYPYSEQASTVLDIFRRLFGERRIEAVTETEIEKASYVREKGQFRIQGNGRVFFVDRLILCAGGPASHKRKEGLGGFALAEQFGHRLHKPVPGLVQLRCGEPFIKAMAGVRAAAEVSLCVDGAFVCAESGEVQFTEYGISGIPVFQLSRIAAYALKKRQLVTVHINFFPEQDEKVFFYTNRLRYESQLEKTLEEFLTGTQNKKINMVMIKQAGFRPEMKVKDTGWKKIWTMMQKYQCFVIPISDINTMEKAQVCAGGVDYTQLSVSLQSKLVKGLYFTGEMLDVDGKCGGYNLQWAWTSGYIAGRNAAKMDKREIKDAEN